MLPVPKVLDFAVTSLHNSMGSVSHEKNRRFSLQPVEKMVAYFVVFDCKDKKKNGRSAASRKREVERNWPLAQASGSPKLVKCGPKMIQGTQVIQGKPGLGLKA